MSERKITVNGRVIRLTNLEKVLWPGGPFTKWDLIRYMTIVGPYLLSHLRNRPLTVVRYPNGIEGNGFYQKNAPDYTPDWIATYTVRDGDGQYGIKYILANDLQTLLWLANQGAIEYHPWMSCIERAEFPDYAVIDLDPTEGATFEDARQVASVAKEWLDKLGLHAGVKTSGATGIHIVLPLEPIYPYSVTSRFVALLAELIAKSLPGLATTERLVANRPRGSVYVDHLQNLPGKTIVAPYSPRPTPQATVSAPFPWSELQSVQPTHFTLSRPEMLFEYAAEYGAILEKRQRLELALRLVRSERLTRV